MRPNSRRSTHTHPGLRGWRARLAASPRALVAALVLGLLACGSLPASARENHGWRVRFEAVSVEPSTSLSASIPGFTLGAEIDSAVGFGLGLEYRFGRWVGVELDLATSRHDVALSADSPFGIFNFAFEDSLEATSVTLGVTFHLTPGRPFDIFLGPLIGGIAYSPIDLGVIEGTAIETDWAGEPAIGGQIGVAVRLGDSAWFAHAGARVLDTDFELDIDEEIRIGFDPTEIFFGLGYGF